MLPHRVGLGRRLHQAVGLQQRCALRAAAVIEVLLTGGSSTASGQQTLNQYQLYNATYTTGTVSQTTTSPSLQSTTAYTLLPTVNSILAYGASFSGGATTPVSAEVYNPRTAAWTRTGLPSTDRANLGLVTLFDGSALAVGGFAPGSSCLALCEVYSPSTNAWSLVGSMSVARELVRASFLSFAAIAGAQQCLAQDSVRPQSAVLAGGGCALTEGRRADSWRPGVQTKKHSRCVRVCRGVQYKDTHMGNRRVNVAAAHQPPGAE